MPLLAGSMRAGMSRRVWQVGSVLAKIRSDFLTFDEPSSRVMCVYQTREEVNLERWQGTLRWRDSDLYPDLACAVPFGEARVGDLRWSVGPDYPEPRPESLR